MSNTQASAPYGLTHFYRQQLATVATGPSGAVSRVASRTFASGNSGNSPRGSYPLAPCLTRAYAGS